MNTLFKRSFLAVIFGVIFFILSNRISELLPYNSNTILHNLVFVPFSLFITILFFIGSFLLLSRLIFYLSFSTVTRLEQFLYLCMLIGSIIIYQWLLICLISISLIYLYFDVHQYNKKCKRLKR